jgi:hypothetical protein
VGRKGIWQVGVVGVKFEGGLDTITLNRGVSFFLILVSMTGKLGRID